MNRRKNLNNINTVLFDVDGTLLNTTEFIFQSYENTFRKFNLPRISRGEIANLMGKPLEECYKYLAPSFPLKILCKTHLTFQLENLQLIAPYVNTKSTLQNLKKNHIRIGAVTTRSNLTSIKSLQITGIHSFFDVVISGDDVKYHKPHSEPLLKALGILKAEKGKAVMVGDTESDILAGKNAGVLTIGVTYGFHKEKIVDANPDFTLNDVSEILQLLSRT